MSRTEFAGGGWSLMRLRVGCVAHEVAAFDAVDTVSIHRLDEAHHGDGGKHGDHLSVAARPTSANRGARGGGGLVACGW